MVIGSIWRLLLLVWPCSGGFGGRDVVWCHDKDGLGGLGKGLWMGFIWRWLIDVDNWGLWVVIGVVLL